MLKAALSKVCLHKCRMREVYGMYYEFMELSFSLLPAASSFFSLHLAVVWDRVTPGVSWAGGGNTAAAAPAATKSLQSCPTLCDPIDGSPPGSPVPGILKARTPEWVAVSFSNAWKWKVKVKSVIQPCQTLSDTWSAAQQAPPSMGFSRQVLEWGAIAFSGSNYHRCDQFRVTFIVGIVLKPKCSYL